MSSAVKLWTHPWGHVTPCDHMAPGVYEGLTAWQGFPDSTVGCRQVVSMSTWIYVDIDMSLIWIGLCLNAWPGLMLTQMCFLKILLNFSNRPATYGRPWSSVFHFLPKGVLCYAFWMI